MTEGGEGIPQNENERGNWETTPRPLDLTQVPIHKAAEAFQKRGTQVSVNAPEPGGKVTGEANRLSVEGMPKAPWWDLTRFFRKR